MKTKSLTRFLLSICLMLVFSMAPIAVSSQGLHIPGVQAPVQPLGANGDGFADLAIGIPGRDYATHDGAGMVGVVYGASPRLDYDSSQTFDQSTTGIADTPEYNDHFGQALAGGDFNGDGYLDLAIGVPDETISGIGSAGCVAILFGSNSGYSGPNSQFIQQSHLSPNIAEYGDRFGAALASGDFNRDGYDDLAIGVPGQDFPSVESAGRVNVVYGAPGGLSTVGWYPVTQGVYILELPEEADNFGSVLAAGDFDGDGYHDLAIGVPDEDMLVGVDTLTDAGVVQVVHGSADGISTDGDVLLYQGYDGLQDQPENNDKFGSSLAAGDYDGNGRDDLAIGVPFENFSVTDDGIAHILWGGINGITTDLDRLVSQGAIPGQANAANELFGWALAAGNFNGDDNDDLAIGVPGQDVSGNDQAGSIHILYGSFSSFASALTADNAYPAAEDMFGFSLAAGNINGSYFDDLVVGMPYFNSGIKDDMGILSTMYSDQDGIDTSWQWVGDLYQISAGVMNGLEDDLFAYSLVVLDEHHWLYKYVYLPLVRK